MRVRLKDTLYLRWSKKAGSWEYFWPPGGIKNHAWVLSDLVTGRITWPQAMESLSKAGYDVTSLTMRIRKPDAENDCPALHALGLGSFERVKEGT